MQITNNNNNSCYFQGQREDVEVVIMYRNGYVNATALCLNGDKTLDGWLKKTSSKALVDCLEKSLKSDSSHKDPPMITVSGKNDYTDGTYVHGCLIANFAEWISPETWVNVYGVMEDYRVFLINDATEERDLAVQDLSDFMNQMDIGGSIPSNTNALSRRNEVLEMSIDCFAAELSKARSDNEAASKRLEKLRETLDRTVEVCVVKTEDSSLHHQIVIFDESTNKKPNRFHILKRQEKSMASALKAYHKNNELKKSKPKEFARIDYCPNAFVFYNLLKEEFGESIKSSYNSIKLVDSEITKDEFKKRINEIGNRFMLDIEATIPSL